MHWVLQIGRSIKETKFCVAVRQIIYHLFLESTSPPLGGNLCLVEAMKSCRGGGIIRRNFHEQGWWEKGAKNTLTVSAMHEGLAGDFRQTSIAL